MRSLVSFLNERGPQELRVIAEYWQANLTDRLYTGNTFQLSQEMQSEFLQRRVIEKLSPMEINLLEAFVRQADFSSSWADLSMARPDLAGFQPQLAALRKAGLLFDQQVRDEGDDSITITEPPKKQPGWSELYSRRKRAEPSGPLKVIHSLPREIARPFARLLAEKTLSDRPVLADRTTLKLSHLPLPQLLAGLEPESLEIQGENWGILTLVGEADPATLAAELARSLSDAALQKSKLAELPPESLELFQTLNQGQGRTTIPALLEEFVSVRRLGRHLRPLTELLLVWEVFEDGQSLIFIPAEVRHPLETVRPSQQLIQTVAEPTNATAFPPYALAWDTLTYLNYLVQYEVELTAKSFIPKRDIKKLSTQLWRSEDPAESYRLSFLINLSHRLLLYTTDLDTNRLVPGAGLDEWLKLDFLEQMRRLIKIWREEAVRLGPVLYPYQYANANTVNRANSTMLDWLAECEPGVWYSLTALVEKVQREDPYFIMPRRDLLNMVGAQRLAELSKLWPRLEGTLIRQTFQTALEWLGIVRVGRGAEGEVTSFALTALGAEVCGQAPAQALPLADKPLLVQPNFEVMLFAPSVETVWLLQKFTNSKKLDQVSLFMLTRDALLRGLESGLRLSAISTWLAERNPQPLPQNLLVSLEDWSRSFRRVSLGPVTLLEVDDPAVLDELIGAKAYAEYFVRRLSPTAALVRLPAGTENRRSNPLKTLKAKLKAGGFYAD